MNERGHTSLERIGRRRWPSIGAVGALALVVALAGCSGGTKRSDETMVEGCDAAVWYQTKSGDAVQDSARAALGQTAASDALAVYKLVAAKGGTQIQTATGAYDVSVIISSMDTDKRYLNVTKDGVGTGDELDIAFAADGTQGVINPGVVLCEEQGHLYPSGGYAAVHGMAEAIATTPALAAATNARPSEPRREP